jgi:flagellar FliL protein
MAKEQPQAEEEQASGGKKKMIMIIVGALLLVGIAVGATLFLVGGDDSATAAAADAAPEEAPKPERGDPTYVELKPFTVNLGPEDTVGFLQVQINVLTYFDDVAEQLDKNKPLIRNNLTLLFGQQKSEDLRSPEGKVKLQNEVKDSIQQVINKYGSGGEIENVFFTTFVMQ